MPLILPKNIFIKSSLILLIMYMNVSITASCFAEYIELKTGEIVEGEIIDSSTDSENGWVKIKDNSGKSVVYHYNEMEILAAIENGIYEDFYPNGNIYSQTSYKNSRLNGISKLYFENKRGALWKSSEYKDGILNGLTKTYYQQGTLEEEIQYKFNQPIGTYKAFHPNGKLKETFAYIDGMKNGNYKKYSEKGLLTEEGKYQDDMLQGTIKTYYENGNVKQEIDYNKDYPISNYRTFDINGNFVEEIPFMADPPQLTPEYPTDNTNILTPIEQFTEDAKNTE